MPLCGFIFIDGLIITARKLIKEFFYAAGVRELRSLYVSVYIICVIVFAQFYLLFPFYTNSFGYK